MHIGIIMTGRSPEPLRERFGDYDEMFQNLLSGDNRRFTEFPVVEGAKLVRPDSMDGWVITGSRHGVYEPLPWIRELEDFIRNAHAHSVPVAGICFGHQIMAQALGGKVEKFKGGWAVGRKSYRGADGKDLHLNAIHQDQVVQAPPDSQLLLTNDFCRIAALSYGRNAFSLQAHPEFNNDFLAELIQARRGTLLPEQVADEALGSLSDDVDSPLIGERLSAFLSGKPIEIPPLVDC